MKNKARHAIAVNLIESHLRGSTGVISTQVLQEFVNAALHLEYQRPADPIRSRLALYERFAVIPASPELTGSALNLHLSQAVSY